MNHSPSAFGKVSPEAQDLLLEHSATHSAKETLDDLPADLVNKLISHRTRCKSFQNFKDGTQVAVFESHEGDVFRLKLTKRFWEVMYEGPWKKNQVMESGHYKLPLTGPTIDLLKRRMQDTNRAAGSKQVEQRETKHPELHKKHYKNQARN